MTKYNKLRDLNNRIYCLTILEAGSQGSDRAMLPSEPQGRSWPVSRSCGRNSRSPRGVPSVRACAQTPSPYEDTGHTG